MKLCTSSKFKVKETKIIFKQESTEINENLHIANLKVKHLIRKQTKFQQTTYESSLYLCSYS